MPEQNTKTSIDYLIVDNRQERRDTIEKILGNDKEYHLASTGNARTAREVLFSHQVAFVIAAGNMPRMTGIEFLRLFLRINSMPVILGMLPAAITNAT